MQHFNFLGKGDAMGFGPVFSLPCWPIKWGSKSKKSVIVRVAAFNGTDTTPCVYEAQVATRDLNVSLRNAETVLEEAMGAVPARFRPRVILAEGQSFECSQIPEERWNGWACPRFTPVQAEVVAAHWREGGFEALWDPKTQEWAFQMHTRGGEDAWERYKPDPDGLVGLGRQSWCWSVDEDEEGGEPASRKDYCDALAGYWSNSKATANEIAADIEAATGVKVTIDADDMLAALTDLQIRHLWAALAPAK